MYPVPIFETEKGVQRIRFSRPLALPSVVRHLKAPEIHEAFAC